jgi:hypothetical protein
MHVTGICYVLYSISRSKFGVLKPYIKCGQRYGTIRYNGHNKNREEMKTFKNIRKNPHIQNQEKQATHE